MFVKGIDTPRHVHTKKEDLHSQMRGEKPHMVSTCGEKIENLRESVCNVIDMAKRRIEEVEWSEKTHSYTIIESTSEMERGIS